MTPRLRELGQYVARHEDALLRRPLPQDEVRRQAVAEHAAARSGKPKGNRRMVFVMTAAALAAAVAFVLWRGAVQPESLSFAVGAAGRPGVVNEWVSAPADEPLALRFSDGSEVSLAADARARVVRLLPSGAELVVEAGRASFDVEHGERSAWRVRTGPFVVRVTGTRFDVEWNAETDGFRLELHEGRVVVSGCALGDGQTIEAGQVVRASCNPSQALIASADEGVASAGEGAAAADEAVEAGRDVPSESAAGAPADSPAAAPAAGPNETSPGVSAGDAAPLDRAEPSSPAGSALPAPQPERVSWQSLARQGHYAEAYRRASALGFDTEIERRSAEEGLLLAGAARLSGHASQARHAYRRLRARFPGTPAAARAAFQLGRLEATSRGATAAVDWFETYLDEEPAGPFASAALGRLLEAAAEQGDRARAIRIAKRYVARYPAGAHADEARQILDSAPVSD